MAKAQSSWHCTSCQHVQPRWQGQCPKCGGWGTLEEVAPSRHLQSPKAKRALSKVWTLGEIPLQGAKRASLGIPELDRCFGGGLVPGSLTLLGGEPGIGKSTLLLQVCEAQSRLGLDPLYISGEESLAQIALRAKRLGIEAQRLRLLSEVTLESIVQHLLELKPKLVIIDSIQVVAKADIPSAPGSPLQLRECTSALLHLAKQYGIAMILIGHITKSGDLAGPKVLEHMVDTVISFERDPSDSLRFLRINKNRFGPTDELALFSMERQGLIALESPSSYFVKQRSEDPIGSMVAPIVEGSRAFLLDVQALVCKSYYPTPMRKASGIDPSRLTILLAVLERYTPLSVAQCDVFVSLTEGLRVHDASLDLAILLAVASAAVSKPITLRQRGGLLRCAASAEVGLNGQLRPVKRLEARAKELHWMGIDALITSDIAQQKPKRQDATEKTFPLDLVRARSVAQVLEMTLDLKDR